MSWSYESAYITGYTTGTTGLEIMKPLTFFVSGLSYDGTGITVVQSKWFTGYGIIGSGDISTEVSGNLVYYKNEQYWRADLIVLDQNSPGELATGCFELYWNTGSTSASTGWETPTGFVRMFGNSALDAWNILTNEDGSVDNADALHSHEGAAQTLTELTDTNIPGTIADGSGLVWDAGTSKWITGTFAGVTDHGELDGLGDLDHPQYVQTGVFDAWTGTEYETTSGAVADYPAVSGVIADYPTISGDFASINDEWDDISGYGVDWNTNSGTLADYPTVSGDYASTSGTIADYPTVSGSHSALSGALADYGTVSGSHSALSGAVADYGTVSGAVSEVSGSHSALSGAVADYPTVSGTVSTIDGDYVKTDASRGVSGTMEFTGAIYVGDVAGGNYFKFYVDGSDLRIDAIGGATIVVSGNLSGIDSSKIYGAVLL